MDPETSSDSFFQNVIAYVSYASTGKQNNP